jgi:trimeric autotransporter adhesin
MRPEWLGATSASPSSNWGNFRGTNAMSFIAQARISGNIVANAAFTGGFQYGGIGTRAGLTFAW